MTFFRVKLHGEQIVARKGRVELHTVFTASRYQCGIFCMNVIAVHKIKTRILRDIGPQWVIIMMHLIPSHVRDLERVALSIFVLLTKKFYLAGQKTNAVHALIFFAVIHQRLHTDTNTQHGFAGGNLFAQQLIKTESLNFSHAIANGADAGKNHSVGGGHLRGIGSDFDIDIQGHMLDGTGNRVKVAHAIVDNSER